ncbi:FliG C-terminal domain-containing protein [Shigella sonnei]
MFLFENLVISMIAAFSVCCRKWIPNRCYRAERGRAATARDCLAICRSVPPNLRDNLANRGPVRLSQVENEQKAILLIVRGLAETGEMVIGSGEDTYV